MGCMTGWKLAMIGKYVRTSNAAVKRELLRQTAPVTHARIKIGDRGYVLDYGLGTDGVAVFGDGKIRSVGAA